MVQAFHCLLATNVCNSNFRAARRTTNHKRRTTLELIQNRKMANSPVWCGSGGLNKGEGHVMVGLFDQNTGHDISCPCYQRITGSDRIDNPVVMPAGIAPIRMVHTQNPLTINFGCQISLGRLAPVIDYLRWAIRDRDTQVGWLPGRAAVAAQRLVGLLAA